MSQMPATTALRMPRRVAPARPDLRVVTGRGATRVAAPPQRLPFVMFCSVLLALGLLALLLINVALAQGTYALHDLKSQSVVLGESEQQLREELAMLESPAHLAEAATEIGMVPGGVPAYLDVSDGTVTGQAKPAPTPTESSETAATGRKGTAGPKTGATGSPSASGGN